MGIKELVYGSIGLGVAAVATVMLFVAYKVVPCLTGEVVRTSAVSAAGELLIATSPVCPETGQLFARITLTVIITLTLAIAAVVAVGGTDAVGDAAVAIGAMRLGQQPGRMIDLQARQAPGPDAYLTVAQVEAMLAKARLDDARADDLRGQSDWTAGRPALPPSTNAPSPAPATAGQNGHGGNGSNGHRVFKAEDWK